MTATITSAVARRTAAALATAALTMGAATAGAGTANAAGTPAPTPGKGAARTSGTAGLKGVDYAAWQREVKSAIDGARPYVAERTANARQEKQAIVLDIDNSSLETDFHWTYPTPAIEPVLELTRYAHARGAAVFFVTARPGLLDAPTEYNLRRVGYPVSGLYVRHFPDLFRDVSAYKTAKRAEIEAQGYRIIANIGNNTTDLVGGHAERTVKLPDYEGKLS
ncbi:hydrolase [Streptomyces eurocidicus]|uniref:Hydrolase n=1 Tax=Streptomyces eurocidicus TaxID=66423 RepID=A0A2N8NR54_STREU|nr:HAD family acid phosphatase [Streptomyces eurocidicus]MBB5117035.1 putative secreted acid phosphatase [Streptomyces eurocidicus]MBF6052668.1 hydrolase [Streptomyces eurocidicus]PNE31245.1 hydrolase [Streptomyces eurocidicus]